ncbi:MAG: lysylphosphatidylglycerol synthase domain-containing protein, partial [Burkholderiales bacterium]
VRGWVVTRHTGRIQNIAASLIADRLVALFAACLLLVLSYPLLSPIALPFTGFFAMAAVLVSGAVLVAFLLACSGALKRAIGLQRWLAGSLSAIDGVALRPRPILAAIAVAVGIHAIATTAAAVTAAAYGIDPSLKIWLSIIPMSIIASALPISINGWGVREAVIVGLAAAHGIAQADALLVSLTLGALNVIASLPGAYLLLHHPRR